MITWRAKSGHYPSIYESHGESSIIFSKHYPHHNFLWGKLKSYDNHLYYPIKIKLEHFFGNMNKLNTFHLSPQLSEARWNLAAVWKEINKGFVCPVLESIGTWPNRSWVESHTLESCATQTLFLKLEYPKISCPVFLISQVGEGTKKHKKWYLRQSYYIQHISQLTSIKRI